MSDFDRNHQEIIIKHIHPLKEKVIGLEKTVEYHEKEMDKISTNLEDLKVIATEGLNLAKRTYWIALGGIGILGTVFAIIKLVIPLFK